MVEPNDLVRSKRCNSSTEVSWSINAGMIAFFEILSIQLDDDFLVVYSGKQFYIVKTQRKTRNQFMAVKIVPDQILPFYAEAVPTMPCSPLNTVGEGLSVVRFYEVLTVWKIL